MDLPQWGSFLLRDPVRLSHASEFQEWGQGKNGV